jgi:hypothetical protein
LVFKEGIKNRGCALSRTCIIIMGFLSLSYFTIRLLLGSFAILEIELELRADMFLEVSAKFRFNYQLAYTFNKG